MRLKKYKDYKAEYDYEDRTMRWVMTFTTQSQTYNLGLMLFTSFGQCKPMMDDVGNELLHNRCARTEEEFENMDDEQWHQIPQFMTDNASSAKSPIEISGSMKLIDDLDEDLQQVIKGLMVMDPSKRMTLEQALEILQGGGNAQGEKKFLNEK